MKTIKTIVLGAGQRGNAYGDFGLAQPAKMRIVGVAEPDEVRREDFRVKHGLNHEECFKSWEEVLGREKWADAVIIATQDNLHHAPAMAAIAKRYDILLEKPISPNPAECLEIANAARNAGVRVVVCHVLRYTPFFFKIKEIIDSGQIGRVVSIVHNENVGDLHHAHSFVRGNWGRTDVSSPMILAKSCHDTDIIQWLAGSACQRLSSFGSLTYFTKDNMPPGAPKRCTDGCKEDCPYDARKNYLYSSNEWFRSVAAGYFNPSDDDVELALKTGPYGRCVFQCDNDVVDHQVVSMEFEDGVTAIFSMSSFTPDISRSVKIMGTKGQIKGHTACKSIVVSRFADRSEREIKVEAAGGHDGGDFGIMGAFCAYLRGEISSVNISEIQISAQNHMISFAAEKSRLNNGAVVELGGFDAKSY